WFGCLVTSKLTVRPSPWQLHFATKTRLSIVNSELAGKLGAGLSKKRLERLSLLVGWAKANTHVALKSSSPNMVIQPVQLHLQLAIWIDIGRAVPMGQAKPDSGYPCACSAGAYRRTLLIHVDLLGARRLI
ncbi:MAG: hypothetical protein ACOC9E_04785, partial [Chloroflexota bacterium]